MDGWIDRYIVTTGKDNRGEKEKMTERGWKKGKEERKEGPFQLVFNDHISLYHISVQSCDEKRALKRDLILQLGDPSTIPPKGLVRS